MTDGGPVLGFIEAESWPDSENDDKRHYVLEFNGGLTLRDWFAGRALTGLVGGGNHKIDASEAYRYADAMLAEREKAK